MKKLLFSIVIALMLAFSNGNTAMARVITIYTTSSRAGQQPPVVTPDTTFTPEGSMTLDSITWASVNVDDYQTFATQPDMYTKFYQWNRETAWAATGGVSGWEYPISDPEWTINPCPAGWRLPTQNEFIALDSVSGGYYSSGTWNGGTWAEANAKGNAVAGRFYGPNHATCGLPNNMVGCVFFPATGYRDSSGALYNLQDTRGGYWANTQSNTTMGRHLTFTSTSSNPADTDNKAYGFAIRCVR
jgi:uncharacterized protein (TIGR02145 family)